MPLHERVASLTMFLLSAVNGAIGVGVILLNERLYKLFKQEAPNSGVPVLAKAIGTAFLGTVDVISDLTRLSKAESVMILGTGMVVLAALTIVLSNPTPPAGK